MSPAHLRLAPDSWFPRSDRRPTRHTGDLGPGTSKVKLSSRSIVIVTLNEAQLKQARNQVPSELQFAIQRQAANCKAQCA
jgi:hypothetical protein